MLIFDGIISIVSNSLAKVKSITQLQARSRFTLILGYIKDMFLYLNVCLYVVLDILSCSFTSISFYQTSCSFTLLCI